MTDSKIGSGDDRAEKSRPDAVDGGAGISNDARAMMAFEAEKKSVGVAYLLWLFLGGLGAHRFYLGETGTAVAILAISLVSWATLVVGVGVFGLVVVGIWIIVDAFLIPGIVRGYNQQLALRFR